MATSVPYIDPRVEHVGVNKLRSINATNVRQLNKALVIQDKDTPLAVLLSYDQFLLMQSQLQAALETVEVLADQEERSALAEALRAVSGGKTKPLSEVRAALSKRSPT
jgi:hypothetical protein